MTQNTKKHINYIWYYSKTALSKSLQYIYAADHESLLLQKQFFSLQIQKTYSNAQFSFYKKTNNKRLITTKD